MTIDQLIAIIERTIRGQRHEWYNHTVDMANLCYQMMTGKDQKATLERFRSRETTKQMEQRERLFMSPTRGFLAPIENMYEKIRFLDSEAIKKMGELTDEKKSSRLTRFLNNAWENQTLDSYLYDVCRYYNFYDPNALIIIEESRIRGLDNEVLDIDVYPIEATAKEVLNYELKRGKVEWAVVEFMDKEELTSKPGKFMDVSKFYLYARGFVIQYLQYHETIPAGQAITEIKVGSKTLKFSVSTFRTSTAETPVMRVGAYLDPETRNETFVAPYWPALLKLDESIRDKSMLDVTIPGHVYMQKFVLAPACEYYDDELNLKCDGGMLGDKVCPACGGKGHNMHVSEQDEIVLALPKEGLELPDLSKLIYWHTPPEWLPAYMDQRLKELEKNVFWLTFNTQLVESPMATETATGRNMDYEAIQQKMTPYAKLISDCWRKYVRVSVQYLEEWNPDFVVEHSFPKDHKLQSATELMEEYKKAKGMGLAYPVLERIEDKILSKERVDNPQEVAIYRAFRVHLPFKDKSESTAMRIVSERSRDDFDRLIWENSDKVYNRLKDRYGDAFPVMQMEAQRKLIQEILNEVKGEIIYQQEPEFAGADFN